MLLKRLAMTAAATALTLPAAAFEPGNVEQAAAFADVMTERPVWKA